MSDDCKQQMLNQCRSIAADLEEGKLIDDGGTTYDWDEVTLLECNLYAVDKFDTYAPDEYEDTENGWRILETGEEIDSTDDADIAALTDDLIVIRDGGEMTSLREMHGFDYLSDVLDFEYRVNSQKEYMSAEILVAFGGPNIWIDTKRGLVMGAWWGDTVSVPYVDGIGLDEALEELFSY